MKIEKGAPEILDYLYQKASFINLCIINKNAQTQVSNTFVL